MSMSEMMSKFHEKFELFGNYQDRMTYEGKSPDNRDFDAYQVHYGIQHTADKLRKMHGYLVHSTQWNPDDKSITINVLETVVDPESGVSKRTVVPHLFTYEMICDKMNWHSFKVVGFDILKPKWMTFDEVEAKVHSSSNVTFVKSEDDEKKKKEK